MLNPLRKDNNVPGVFTTTDSMNFSYEEGTGKFFFLQKVVIKKHNRDNILASTFIVITEEAQMQLNAAKRRPNERVILPLLMQKKKL